MPTGWRWCRRCRGPGRPMKPRFVTIPQESISIAPLDQRGFPILSNPIQLTPDELEAFKLVYYDGLKQEEAARRMGVSRGTFWRCLDSARRKIARAIVERRPLIVSTG